MNIGRFVAIVPAAVCVVHAALAHHSYAEFDTRVERVVTGELVSFEWTSPHTVVNLLVTDARGRAVEWALEGMSPSHLGRRGWTRNTLLPGQHLRVVVYPLASGEPGGLFVRATLPDGTVRQMIVSDAAGG